MNWTTVKVGSHTSKVKNKVQESFTQATTMEGSKVKKKKNKKKKNVNANQHYSNTQEIPTSFNEIAFEMEMMK